MSDLLKSMIKPAKVLVLSKTGCPYCSSSKQLLHGLNLKNLEIVELNNRADGRDLQNAALSFTGQSTVPNIWVGTRHIGGNSDIQALYKSGELSAILKAEGCI